ncbi:hypothetical protein FJY63_01660, partial [Candidatus Sumerlaeota bacterium]|nr:hypothetical protein [Candidatus Sumerlaeota bacterium]
MQTFRLRLEQDPDIPRFKRLAFEKVKVPIADVLLRGIHPWMGGNVHPSLNDKFAEILNADKMKIAKLAQFGYCAELHCGYSVYTHSNEDSPFQATLQHVREGIRFVDHLSYAELLDIAKERLRRLWSHEVVRDLLSNSKGN